MRSVPDPPGRPPYQETPASSFFGAPSPGEWEPPPGVRPGWDWLPEYGASPNLAAIPRWARAWYRTPWVDRYAYEWMWWHGGWSVWVPAEPPPDPPPAGDRAPLIPPPVSVGPASHGSG